MDFLNTYAQALFGGLSATQGLGGLFLSAFISATLFPGGSEAVLLGWVLAHPEQRWLAVGIATLGNTLGGLTTYGCGRLLPRRIEARLSPRALAWLRGRGAAALLFSWLPVIGDGICLAAGWLRLPLLACAVAMALGKGLRYAALLLV